MKKSRDNFSKIVISRLERRVNGHCSNPDCRVPTSGPNLGKDSAACIGIAAHIAAAAQGGPRYDKDQTAEERKSFTNAIWLCVNCATRIDRDEKRFTVKVLEEWKQQAEQDAFDEMGKAPISRKSYDVLTAAALGNLPKKYVVSAIDEICKLSVNELGKLDPRFSVDVAYLNKRTIYTLQPNEDIDCNMMIAGPVAEDFLKSYSELVDHGTAVEVDMAAVVLTGSPLFDLHNGKKGKFIIESTNKRSAVCKISIEAKSKRIALDDIRGELIGGKKSVSFSGNTFDDCLSLKLGFDISKGPRKSSDFTIKNKYATWNGRSLSKLPYFSRIYEFYEAAAQGGLVQISLEIDGEEIMSGEGADIIKRSEAREVLQILRYIRCAREVTSFIGSDVIFKDGIKLDAEEVASVESFYCLVFELPKLRGTEIGKLAFTLQPDDPTSPELAKLMSGEPTTLRVSQEFSSPLNIFGALIEIPKINIIYTAMRLAKSAKSADGGIEITLEPDTECRCHVDLANPR